jgi:hypothetical protein
MDNPDTSTIQEAHHFKLKDQYLSVTQEVQLDIERGRALILKE